MTLDNVRNYIKSILKPHGFKSNGNSFFISREAVSCVINIQTARFNSQDFTLNWGIYSKFFEFFYNKKIPKKISLNSCTIIGRVWFLQGKGGDKWWNIDSKNQDEEEIKILLENYAIPFLQHIHKLDDIIDLLDSSIKNKQFHNFAINHPNPEPFQAILYSFLGDKNKSYEILDQVINSTKSDLYRENLETLKSKIKNFNPSESN